MFGHQRAHGEAHPRRDWILGSGAAVVASAALAYGSEDGNFHSSALHPKVIAWSCAAAIVVFGVAAARRLSSAMDGVVSQRGVPAAGAALRLVSSGVGYIIVVFSVFSVLGVSIARLLVGVGLAGVVLGIAAQQSLGNVVAAIVLLFARPFSVGDYIRIRSGVVGVLDVTVVGIGLTYVTVRTEDGDLKIPNSAVLAAGIGQLPRPAPPEAS